MTCRAPYRSVYYSDELRDYLYRFV
ncbi:hypothetical protein U2A404210123 [Corynebacterium striatum]|nr:hypothetical protein U2A404210123 [Corynebacterium striatum]